MRIPILVSFMLFLLQPARSQEADILVKNVRAKLDLVKDYRATGKLKTDVSFMKIPVSNVQVFYKKPNRFRVKKDGGISLLPKGNISINLNALMLNDEYTAVPAGESVVDGIPVRIVKLLPLSENADVILTTLYIDTRRLLICKSVTTTRENGTYDMLMTYGKFSAYGLPDKVIFSFNTKDYKLPKGVTFEYDAGETRNDGADKLKNKKGKVEIQYDSYAINQGLSDDVFK